MAYIVRVRRGGYIYLYEGRSRRVKGKKNPVSERVYIGRVDVETRAFIPKKYRVKGSLDIESGEVRDRGLPRIPDCYLPLREERVTSSRDRA